MLPTRPGRPARAQLDLSQGDRQLLVDPQLVGHQSKVSAGSPVRLRPVGRSRVEATAGVEACVGANRQMRWIGTGNGPGALAIGSNDVWVANRASRTVARLDPHSLDLTAVTRLRGLPIGVAAQGDVAWVICSNGWLWRISSSGAHVEGVARTARGARAIATTQDAVWVLKGDGGLARLDTSIDEVVAETRLPRLARRLVAGHGALWAICHLGRKVLRVDASDGEVTATFPTPRPAVSLAVGPRSVLIGCGRRWPAHTGWMYSLNPSSGELFGGPTRLPGRPRALGEDLAGAWVACETAGRQCTIERLDLDGRLARWHETVWPVSDLAVSGESLLLAMSISTPVPDGGAETS